MSLTFQIGWLGLPWRWLGLPWRFYGHVIGSVWIWLKHAQGTFWISWSCRTYISVFSIRLKMFLKINSSHHYYIAAKTLVLTVVLPIRRQTINNQSINQTINQVKYWYQYMIVASGTWAVGLQGQSSGRTEHLFGCPRDYLKVFIKGWTSLHSIRISLHKFIDVLFCRFE